MDTSLLIWGLAFSVLGMGYFMYGKKQKSLAPLCTGLALCIFPYFMNNVYVLVLIGTGLLTVPYFFRD
ncbi:MAG: hypothetical protein DHS20C11_35910 [Lysobacteraceae bacterium]|nr:MAG: hypothetical protein DHS20C11_35910 [Xanthomonadaceae bacterium]